MLIYLVYITVSLVVKNYFKHNKYTFCILKNFVERKNGNDIIMRTKKYYCYFLATMKIKSQQTL